MIMAGRCLWMNVYFWSFAAYAFLITPVGAQVHVRAEHGLHYRIRLRMGGLPVLVKKEKQNPQKEIHVQPEDVMKGARDMDGALIVALMKQGHLQRLFRLFDWKNVELHARISFAEAAQTALTYALIRTFLQTLARVHPVALKGSVEADFRGEGSCLSLRCIAQARLGRLLAAAIRLWLAVLLHRTERMKMEEEQYAAASH